MPTFSPHPHVAWRKGRPRFQPGPGLRAAGHKGHDLRHEDGRWFSRGEAIEWSRKFREDLPPRGKGRADQHAPVSSLAARHKGPVNPATRGYIYFLWVNDRIKIGFTRKPGQRMADLQTGIGHPLGFIAVIPGTMADERALHDLLRGRRAQGEWFKPTLKVIRVIQREIEKALGPLAAPSEIMDRATKQTRVLSHG